MKISTYHAIPALAALGLLIGSSAASGDTVYNGPNAVWVHKLLARSAVWSCPVPGRSPGQVPNVPTELCQRDAHVAAAAAHAWAAECYARTEQDVKARREAEEMVAELRNAEQFCSVCDADVKRANGGSIPPQLRCSADAVFGCCELSGTAAGAPVPTFDFHGSPENSPPPRRQPPPPAPPPPRGSGNARSAE